MRNVVCFITLCLSYFSAFGQSTVTLTVGRIAQGRLIPSDFIGESFETASLLPNHAGVKGFLFDSTNTELVTLFKNLGIKNLRIGGSSVDRGKIMPSDADIDALFRFAKAAGVNVIYTLRLYNGNADENASVAKYIWKNYRNYLDCFAIGNEPDWHTYHIGDSEIFEMRPGVPGTAYPSYILKWRKFAKAILDSVPRAKFSGPDAGQNFPVAGATDTGYEGISWTANFINDENKSGIIDFFTQHNYVGQNTDGKTKSEVVREMLSPAWDKVSYPQLYNASCKPAIEAGLPFRLTESNSFSGGIDGGNNVFATALFALDYLHWWAEHNAFGINFHTTEWRFNGTFRLDREGNYQINPMGYGIAAFSISGHGTPDSVSISNPDRLNLTSYAIKDPDGNLFVTIINREHGPVRRDAEVNIRVISRADSVMYLRSPDDDLGDTTGITLGGAPISNSGTWHGKWTVLSSANSDGCKVDVPASSAAIVKLVSGTSWHHGIK